MTVSINSSGEIFLQASPILLEELFPKLRAITGEKPDTRIFVRGDKEIGYGLVMEVMGSINRAGFNKVALITQMPLVPERRD